MLTFIFYFIKKDFIRSIKVLAQCLPIIDGSRFDSHIKEPITDRCFENLMDTRDQGFITYERFIIKREKKINTCLTYTIAWFVCNYQRKERNLNFPLK